MNVITHVCWDKINSLCVQMTPVNPFNGIQNLFAAYGNSEVIAG